MKQLAWNKVKRIAVTFIIAVLGGALFILLDIPVPWLLGPMTVMAIGTNAMKLHFVWSRSLRNTGLIIVGYTIGLSMTAAALHKMALQLPFMLSMSVLLMLLCAGISSEEHKFVVLI